MSEELVGDGHRRIQRFAIGSLWLLPGAIVASLYVHGLDPYGGDPAIWPMVRHQLSTMVGLFPWLAANPLLAVASIPSALYLLDMLAFPR